MNFTGNVTQSVDVAENIWLVLSNLPFLVDVILFLSIYCHTEALAALHVFFSSSLYHMCANLNVCLVFNLAQWEYMDFISAYGYFGIIIIFALDVRPRKYKQLGQLIMLILASILSFVDVQDYYTYAIFYGLCVVLVSLNFTLYTLKWIKDKRLADRICDLCICDNKFMKWIYSTRKAPFNPIDLVFVFISLLCSSFALVFQIIAITYPSIYWIFHSLWHVFLSLSADFLVILWNKKNICNRTYRHNVSVIGQRLEEKVIIHE